VPGVPPPSSTLSDRPVLSVIVPVRNGEMYLPASLAALCSSELPRDCWELIVVDDSSRDGSVEVAHRYADRVIRLTDGAQGPGFARNRGAEVARGRVLMFVDADVCVHPDALSLAFNTLQAESDVSAAFGCYDSTPPATGLISQYRNLLHRYVHLRDAGEAVTFWAGCGAMRKDVFYRAGGFDESPDSRAIEDIELGYRVSEQGHRIVLRPGIQGSHLKRWTLWNMVITDVRYRGIPWMRLLKSRRDRPSGSLNVRTSEKACTLLAAIGVSAVSVWLWTGLTAWLAMGAATIPAILVLNAPLLAWFARQRGVRFAASTIPLRLLYYILNVVSVLVGFLSPSLQRDPRLSLSKTLV